MKWRIPLMLTLLLVSSMSAAVITGDLFVQAKLVSTATEGEFGKFCEIACERDPQCGGGMCCAVSLWIRTLRMCSPMGREGDDCHPMSHKVPFFGRRLHHTCPCLPNLACIATQEDNFKCLNPYKFQEYEL